MLCIQSVSLGAVKEKVLSINNQTHACNSPLQHLEIWREMPPVGFSCLMLHLYEWQEDVQQNIATRNIKESSFFLQINESFLDLTSSFASSHLFPSFSKTERIPVKIKFKSLSLWWSWDIQWKSYVTDKNCNQSRKIHLSLIITFNTGVHSYIALCFWQMFVWLLREGIKNGK